MPSSRYNQKTPVRAIKIKSVTVVCDDDTVLELDVNEGFFVETDSAAFRYEVKIHDGFIIRED